MPKLDKAREMQERLARIGQGLSCSDLTFAIKQLGDGIYLPNFDPTKPVESLSLYQSAVVMDGKAQSPNGFAKKLEGLYGQIQSAFEAYQKRKATEVTIDTLAKQAPVDDRMERIGYYGDFSWIYRTQETRMLDTQFKEELDEDGTIALVTSTLMHVFGDIANDVGYFAGVRLNELRRQVKDSDLEGHVRNGFVALKTCQEDGRNIAVPLRF